MSVFGGPIGTVVTEHEHEEQQEPTAPECVRCGEADVELYTQQFGDCCVPCLDEIADLEAAAELA